MCALKWSLMGIISYQTSWFSNLHNQNSSLAAFMVILSLTLSLNTAMALLQFLMQVCVCVCLCDLWPVTCSSPILDVAVLPRRPVSGAHQMQPFSVAMVWSFLSLPDCGTPVLKAAHSERKLSELSLLTKSPPGLGFQVRLQVCSKTLPQLKRAWAAEMHQKADRRSVVFSALSFTITANLFKHLRPWKVLSREHGAVLIREILQILRDKHTSALFINEFITVAAKMELETPSNDHNGYLITPAKVTHSQFSLFCLGISCKIKAFITIYS